VTRLAAYDALMAAYDARGAARQRAREEVDRQFAPIIKRRTEEFARVNREASNG
jgi:hypothetical protein